MDPEVEKHLIRLEQQNLVLKSLLAECLEILRNSALQPWQRLERGRCERLIRRIRALDSRSPRS